MNVESVCHYSLRTRGRCQSPVLDVKKTFNSFSFSQQVSLETSHHFHHHWFFFHVQSVQDALF